MGAARSQPPNSGVIHVGVAGWSYPDWRGVFYPDPPPPRFVALAYLARYFSVAEINSSFYRPPRAEWAQRWLRQVESRADFQFTAKLWRGFTHERNATAEDEKAVRWGLRPLLEANRLGALLLQFPWAFKNTADERSYLANVIERFREYPLVVEVRHESWNRPESLKWLRKQQVGICNIDQPLIGRSLKPSDCATSNIGYVRIHGRNTEHWFAKNESAGERYDYLYSLGELKPWSERIKQVAAKTKTVYVIANNHPNAQAAVNALQLENLISSKPVEAPAILVKRYPQLKEISSAEDQHAPESGVQHQQKLFSF